MSELETKDYEK